MNRYKSALASAAVAAAFLVPAFAFADTVGPINFEPTAYSVGTINAQNGWVKTGSFDANVTATGIPAGFGTQSLQISDAVTSGSFGDQTFSPSTVNEAGETAAVNNGFSGGTRQSHFEAQFTLASAVPNAQQGNDANPLHMSVSPDRGDGARMSYLRFEDQSSGIHVFFDDVTDAGGLGTVATFNETDIATLDRSVPHTIKFVMDFVAGQANDVVKIYIDGILKKTGTTWEDYYRFDPEQVGGGNTVPTVDSLLFRESGTANPADAGKGFLIDALSLVSGSPASAGSSNTIVVTQNDLDTNGPNPATVATDGLNKWFLYNDSNDTVDNTLGSFVNGPATPPHGVGSVEFTLGANPNDRKNIATYQFGGLALNSITTLAYGAYSHSGVAGATESPFFNFNVDFSNLGTWQGRLVYVPSANGAVPQDTWNSFDMINGGNALWTWSKFASNGNKWPDGNTNTYRSWSDILASFPSVKVLSGDSWLGVRVGEPGPTNYVGNIDFFTVGTSTTATTYDFDPAPPAPTTVTVTIDKYVDGVMATAVSANNAVFPFTATYNASNIGSGSDPFSIGPVGNNSANAYEAKTIPLATGASYSAAENTTGNEVVGATCADGKPFALDGYKSGDNLAAAQAATLSATAPQFAGLTNDKVVIVLNKTCPAPTYKVHILKYLNSAEATAVSANNYLFPMTSSWSAVNIGSGTGSYVLGTGFGGATSVYGADTAAMTGPYDYSTSETTTDTDVTSKVVSSLASCVPGDYLLNGYRVSAVSFADAATQPIIPSVSFTASSVNEYVIVDNSSCPTLGSLTINKTTIGGNGTFNFTSNIPGHASFSIVTTGTSAGGTGSITFNNVTPGTYTVTEVAQSGWTQTDSDCSLKAVSAGNTSNCTVTNTKNTTLGVITGYKFEDWDGDGKAFETKWEVGLSGWTIYLDTNNNGSKDANEPSTITDSHGKYTFVGLVAGTYHVREVQQAGWISTYPSSTALNDKYDVVLAAGQVAKKKDFGNFKLGSISGVKFNDLNSNHKKDAGEPGLSGWTIKLKGPGNTVQTVVTGANGVYSFTGLTAGNYTLSEVMQAGWRQTLHPSPVKVRSATAAVNKNFGNTQKQKNKGDHDNDDQYQD